MGDGPARPDLERALDGRGAVFTGYLTGDALAEAYASADVFAFPSRTETFGQVVQEAMASGLPVVAFDAEGVRDLVAHGRTGLLANARDPHAFVHALRSLLEDEEQRLGLGAQAREVAERRTWASVMDALLDVYTAVVAGHERAAAA